jgi:hypothetical protein
MRERGTDDSIASAVSTHTQTQHITFRMYDTDVALLSLALCYLHRLTQGEKRTVGLGPRRATRAHMLRRSGVHQRAISRSRTAVRPRRQTCSCGFWKAFAKTTTRRSGKGSRAVLQLI